MLLFLFLHFESFLFIFQFSSLSPPLSLLTFISFSPYFLSLCQFRFHSVHYFYLFLFLSVWYSPLFFLCPLFPTQISTQPHPFIIHPHPDIEWAVNFFLSSVMWSAPHSSFHRDLWPLHYRQSAWRILEHTIS